MCQDDGEGMVFDWSLQLQMFILAAWKTLRSTKKLREKEKWIVTFRILLTEDPVLSANENLCK